MIRNDVGNIGHSEWRAWYIAAVSKRLVFFFNVSLPFLNFKAQQSSFNFFPKWFYIQLVCDRTLNSCHYNVAMMVLAHYPTRIHN